MKRLAIICAHPVQYYAPLFRLLAKDQLIKVFYHSKAKSNRYDKGFQLALEWDLPLLEGYQYEFSHKLTNICAFKPTAVLIYGWAHLSHLKLMFFFKNRIPVLFRGDSTLIDPKPLWKIKLRAIWLKLIYKYVDFAYYAGSKNKAYFIQYGLKESQLYSMPHAIDIERFSKDQIHEANKIRASFKLKEDDILVLFTGKFILKKGAHLLIQATAQLNNPKLHLLLVGSGPLEDFLKSMAYQQVNSKNIHFLPFQNQLQMPAIYQSCDLFCMPSIGPGETWGLAINEAMATGKAVLSSNCAGASYDLVDHYNGDVFESNHIEDLVKKLKVLTENKPSLKHMGLKSFARIQKFSFHHQKMVLDEL